MSDAAASTTKASPSGAEMQTRWTIARGAAILATRALVRVKVRHLERLPTSGPYVLAPSHRSALDFLFAGCVTGRPLRFMIKEEVWRYPRVGRFVEWFGAFPVSRGAPDRTALRLAQEALAAGDPLVVFPEGTRRDGPAVIDLHEGAAFLALRAGVPIVPVGIGGSTRVLVRGERLPHLFRRVEVVVGEPIFVGPSGGSVRRQRVTELTEQLRVGLQATFDEAERRVRSRATARDGG